MAATREKVRAGAGKAIQTKHGHSVACRPTSDQDVLGFIDCISSAQMPLVLEAVARRRDGRAALLRAASAIAGVELPVLEDAPSEPLPSVDVVALEQASGGMLTSAEVADRLSHTRQNVNEMLKGQRILGVRFGSRWRFPAIQLRQRELLPGLAVVLKGMGDLDPWRKLQVLLSPGEPKEHRPIELLLSGEKGRALVLASRLAAELAHSLDLPIRQGSGSRALDEDLEADLRRDREYDAIQPFPSAT